jgi:ABC-type transport system substrate-binding protein
MRSIRRIGAIGMALVFLLLLSSCGKRGDPNTLVMIIESSPTNLDPRVGIDGQSERIGELMFDALVHRDEHFNLVPWLAERWEIPDPRTYIFHLHRGVRFQNGQPLTSKDVKWTFDSLMQGKIRSTKAPNYRWVERIETPDDFTVIFHLKEPFAALLWNLSDGGIGIVPYGSSENFNRNPIGSGPFRLVSQEQDKEVVLERNDDYWGERPHVKRVRMIVVPDTTTRALELRKGSADVAINALTPDMVLTLAKDPRLKIEREPGSIYGYLAFNLRDEVLKDARVRQALAFAIDREILIHYVWRDEVQPAASILPPQSWAYDPNVEKYNHDPARARKLLDAAGYPAVNGVRFHLTMKTSTEESSRLVVAVLQQQLRDVGIALDIRTFEFATFLADIQKGAFQMYCCLRWIGGNQDPDIFEYVFASSRVPPKGANRSFYMNPRVDALIGQARQETDQAKRKVIYAEVQQILSRDLPYINLWYFDNVLVHSTRVSHLQLIPSGNYDFLKTAELTR